MCSSDLLLDWALYWRRYFSWRRREKAIGERFGSVVVCSEPDRSLVRTVRHVHVVPNSFPSPAVKPRRRVSDPPRIGFIGWLGGGPNSDGVQWFLRHVWPRVKRECPEARLRLVGGGSDRDYPAMGADVDLLGYLQDPTSEIETWRAMIVPIRIGEIGRAHV